MSVCARARARVCVCVCVCVFDKHKTDLMHQAGAFLRLRLRHSMRKHNLFLKIRMHARHDSLIACVWVWVGRWVDRWVRVYVYVYMHIHYIYIIIAVCTCIHKYIQM